jgi:hypothetical protein
MNLTAALLVLAFVIPYAAAEKESASHGTPSKNFKADHEKNGHDPHADHKAILGSEKTAQEFDQLNPDESRRRLRILANKMDKNKDGFVTEDELSEWVHNSMVSLDQEETDERFDEIDQNKDGEITWTEYVHESFGTHDDPQKTPTDPEDRKLLDEDRRYFEAADLNKDGKTFCGRICCVSKSGTLRSYARRPRKNNAGRERHKSRWKNRPQRVPWRNI